MGGFVTKEKFMNNQGNMVHYFEIEGYPLCGGMAPLFKPMMQQLHDREVGLIVTTMIEPLHEGRVIDHKPFGFETGDDNTEWTDAEEGILGMAKDLGIECYHAPVADIGIPVPEVTTALLTKVRDFHEVHPTKKIYVHCWQGKNRSSLILILLLRQVFSVDGRDACRLLYTYNPCFVGMALKQHQLDYLASDQFPLLAPGLYEEEKNNPIIKTPSNHACFK